VRVDVAQPHPDEPAELLAQRLNEVFDRSTGVSESRCGIQVDPCSRGVPKRSPAALHAGIAQPFGLEQHVADVATDQPRIDGMMQKVQDCSPSRSSGA
jgi:hypothetical protein